MSQSMPVVCDCCGDDDPKDGWIYGSDGKPWCSECYREGESGER